MSINNSSSLNSRLLSSASVVGAATLLSRVTGFLRDVVLAYFFGTGFIIQAFIVAYRLPNLLRNLVGEGAVNSALVPVFSKLVSQGKKKDFLSLSSFLFKIVFVSLVIIVIIAEILAPLLVRMIAPGFSDFVPQLYLTVRLSRITFIYVLLVGLMAYHTAILNSLNNFASSAIAPVFLNLSLIAGAFLSHKLLNEPIVGIAWAVIVGGIFQVSCQLPSLARNNIAPWQRPFDFKIDPHIKDAAIRIRRLFLPRVMGAAVYQLNVFIDTIIASLSWLVGAGAVAAIYYANRIIQLPLGVIAFALASALLPRFSVLVANADLKKLTETFIFTMKVIMVVMIPVSFFIGLLAYPIIKAIFERGEFSQYSSQITSGALLFYCLGLFFFAAVRIVLVCFYAFEDTRRPVKIAFICLIVNLLLNIILAFPLKVGGLALASSLTAFLNLSLLCKALKKHIPDLRYGKIFGLPFLRVFACALIMAGGVKLSWQYLFVDWHLLIRLTINLGLAVFLYLSAALLINSPEIKESLRWILKRD